MFISAATTNRRRGRASFAANKSARGQMDYRATRTTLCSMMARHSSSLLLRCDCRRVAPNELARRTYARGNLSNAAFVAYAQLVLAGVKSRTVAIAWNSGQFSQCGQTHPRQTDRSSCRSDYNPNARARENWVWSFSHEL